MARRVSINENGIFIDGKSTVLLCSSLFYFRIPKDSWTDRMDKLIQCGYNCIDVYMPWNYHESSPGKWDFEGQKDIDEFLNLAAKKGLYVIARPGPYICSEWDGGGLPAFMNQSNMRSHDEKYLSQLNRWLEKILPTIEKYQLDTDGSIILLQLENELDFFNCEKPYEYIDYLVNLADSYSMTVPYITCAGQWYDYGSNGFHPGVKAAYNVYSDNDDVYCEDRCFRVEAALHANKTPLMIVETNREHSYLKREYVCGTKLLSPYNQTAGVNYNLYHGLSNWATGKEFFPLSYMTTDYDFNSMITAEGLYRKEAIYGRLFSDMLSCVDGLEHGRPYRCKMGQDINERIKNVHIISDGKLPRGIVDGEDKPLIYAYRFNESALLNVSNLENEEKNITIKLNEEEFSVSLLPLYTALITLNFSFDYLGVPLTLLWSSAEIASITTEGDFTELRFYCHGDSSICFSAVGIKSSEVSVTNDRLHYTGGYTSFDFLVGNHIFKVTISAPRDAVDIVDYIEYDEEKIGSTPLELFSPVEIFDKFDYEQRRVASLEDNGIFRGSGVYKIELPQKSLLLLEKVADIVYAYHNDKPVFVKHLSGEDYLFEADAGSWKFMVDSMGHCNFHDLRKPSLHIGSKKGILNISSVREVIDITSQYYFTYTDDAERSRYPNIMSLNAPEGAKRNFGCVYEREVSVDPKCDRYLLSFEGLEFQAALTVEGMNFGNIDTIVDSIIDITEAVKGTEIITVKISAIKSHSKQGIKRLSLICANDITECGFASLDVDELIGLCDKKLDSSKNSSLDIGYGETLLSGCHIPKKGRDSRIRIEGTNIKLLTILNGNIVGRILLSDGRFPQTKGGSEDSFVIPHAWTGDEMKLIVTGLAENSILKLITIT